MNLYLISPAAELFLRTIFWLFNAHSLHFRFFCKIIKSFGFTEVLVNMCKILHIFCKIICSDQWEINMPWVNSFYLIRNSPVRLIFNQFYNKKLN